MGILLYEYSLENRALHPINIYADKVDNSLQKWIECVNGNDLPGQDKTELKSLLKHGEISEIKRIGGSKDRYFLRLANGNRHLTIFIHEINIVPDFIADLEYKSTEEGGRKSYIASGYRASVRFPFSKHTTPAEQIFCDSDKVLPGEKTKAQMRILNHSICQNKLEAGAEFEIYEAGSIIATGIIVEVINEELKKTNL
jgi:hypothetical protein